jgi:hypothetical protein
MADRSMYVEQLPRWRATFGAPGYANDSPAWSTLESMAAWWAINYPRFTFSEALQLSLMVNVPLLGRGFVSASED